MLNITQSALASSELISFCIFDNHSTGFVDWIELFEDVHVIGIDQSGPVGMSFSRRTKNLC